MPYRGRCACHAHPRSSAGSRAPGLQCEAETGEELEMIVGHIAVQGLLHRGLLSMLRYCYMFIHR